MLEGNIPANRVEVKVFVVMVYRKRFVKPAGDHKFASTINIRISVKHVGAHKFAHTTA